MPDGQAPAVGGTAEAITDGARSQHLGVPECFLQEQDQLDIAARSRAARDDDGVELNGTSS